MRFRGTRSMLMAAVLPVPACASGPLSGREKGALAGGALGAGTGAIIGHQKGKKAEGAAIGGAVGAVTGAIVGDQSDAAYRRDRYRY